MNKVNIKEMIKSDAEKALYRSAATQFTNLIQTSIVTLMEAKGMDEGKLNVVRELMETEFGKAIIASAIGMGLSYVPGEIGEDPRLVRLAEELRVSGIEIVMNEVLGTVIQTLLPAVQNTLSTLPSPMASRLPESQMRVETDETSRHEEEVYEDTKKPSLKVV